MMKISSYKNDGYRDLDYFSNAIFHWSPCIYKYNIRTGQQRTSPHVITTHVISRRANIQEEGDISFGRVCVNIKWRWRTYDVYTHTHVNGKRSFCIASETDELRNQRIWKFSATLKPITLVTCTCIINKFDRLILCNDLVFSLKFKYFYYLICKIKNIQL